MPPVQIRSLGPTDASQFQALRLQGLLECPSAFASSCDEERNLPSEMLATRLTETPDQFILGAFDGSSLVGVVGLMRERHRKLAHKAFIWGMYVAPAFRRRGVGRQLLEGVLFRAESIPGLRQLNLGVNADNQAAKSLYDSLGFRAFGLERGFMVVDGELQDEVHMTRTLGSGEPG